MMVLPVSMESKATMANLVAKELKERMDQR